METEEGFKGQINSIARICSEWPSSYQNFGCFRPNILLSSFYLNGIPASILQLQKEHNLPNAQIGDFIAQIGVDAKEIAMLDVAYMINHNLITNIHYPSAVKLATRQQ